MHTVRAGAYARRVLPVLLACLASAACGSGPAPGVETLDLARLLPTAERRGLAPGKEPAVTVVAGAAPDLRPAIAVVVPSRITWRGLRFANRTVLRTAVSARAGAGSSQMVFRIGISDDRTYEELARQVVAADTPGWTDVHVDLSRYAGWQWSLFYHPDRRCWNLVFNVSGTPGPDAEGLWARPALYADSRAQRDLLANPRSPACP